MTFSVQIAEKDPISVQKWSLLPFEWRGVNIFGSDRLRVLCFSGEDTKSRRSQEDEGPPAASVGTYKTASDLLNPDCIVSVTFSIIIAGFDELFVESVDASNYEKRYEKRFFGRKKTCRVVD